MRRLIFTFIIVLSLRAFSSQDLLDDCNRTRPTPVPGATVRVHYAIGGMDFGRWEYGLWKALGQTDEMAAAIKNTYLKRHLSDTELRETIWTIKSIHSVTPSPESRYDSTYLLLEGQSSKNKPVKIVVPANSGSVSYEVSNCQGYKVGEKFDGKRIIKIYTGGSALLEGFRFDYLTIKPMEVALSIGARVLVKRWVRGSYNFTFGRVTNIVGDKVYVRAYTPNFNFSNFYFPEGNKPFPFDRKYVFPKVPCFVPLGICEGSEFVANEAVETFSDGPYWAQAKEIYSDGTMVAISANFRFGQFRNIRVILPKSIIR